MNKKASTCFRRITAAAAALAIAAGTFTAVGVSAAEGSLLGTYASAAEGVTINSQEVTIYALNNTWKDYLTIPEELPQSFQLEVTGASDVKYSASGSVNVSADGLITPYITTWYWKDGWGSTAKPSDDKIGEYTIEYRPNLGTFTVNVIADGVTYPVTVHVEDYADKYIEDVADSYIRENITDDMSAYDKLVKVAQFIANRKYDYHYSSKEGMIITGGGDCWASTYTAIYFAEKLGYQAWVRNGNRDGGAGSGHMNAMIYDGTDYYVLEAGYGSSSVPRPYYVEKRESLFSFRSVTGGYEVYQYDGQTNPEVLEIPAEYNGKPVVSVGDSAFSSESGIKRVILPETITKIGDGAFAVMTDLESVNVPAAVTEMGGNPFRGDDNADIQIAEGSVFSLVDGIIYKGADTIVGAVGAVSVEIGAEIKNIGDYAFWLNKNITELNIPNTVTSIGHAAFGNMPALTSFSLEDGITAELPSSMLYRDTAITQLYIPASVTSINEYMNNGSSLKTIIGYKNSAAKTFANNKNLNFVEAAESNTITGANILLEGNIGLNIYIRPDAALANAGAYAVISGPNGDEKYTFNKHTSDDGVFKLTYELYAKQMDKQVNIKLFDKDGAPLTMTNTDVTATYGEEGFSYSPLDYITATEAPDFVYKDGDTDKTAKLKALTSAMKTYGSCAERFFDGSSEIPANVPAVTAGDLSAYAFKETNTSGDESKVIAGSSLVLESETSLRIYFEKGTDVSDFYMRTSDNKTFNDYTIKEKDGYNYLEIANIPANKLNTVYTLFLGSSKRYVKISPLSYCHTVLNKYDSTGTNTDLCNVVKALYQYEEAARAFAAE